MNRKLLFWVIGLVMISSVSVTKGGLQSIIGGTGAPSSALGPYTVTPFPEDPRLSNLEYSSVPSPLGGEVIFWPPSSPLTLYDIPEDWATWSHGYSGDVYWTGGEGQQIIALYMPAGTTAFYFYAQPENSGTDTITAVAFDGIETNKTIEQDVSGNAGACYYGFYGTNGTVIDRIQIYSTTDDFAIGEFGIATIPAPDALLLSNIGLCFLMGLKRYRMFRNGGSSI